MKMLTFVSLEEIREYEKYEGSQLNEVKERLGFELTKMIHGEEEAVKAQNAARAIFGAGADNENMPTTTLTDADLTDGEIGLLDLMSKGGLIASNGEGRRLVQQGGVSVDGEKVTNPAMKITKDALANGVVVKKGKKVFHKFTV